MVVDCHSSVPSASGSSVGTVKVRVVTDSTGMDTSASAYRGYGLDQQRVDEGLSQVSSKLSLRDVVFL